MTRPTESAGFQTERLALRPFAPSDVEEVHALVDLDPQDPGMTLEQRRTAITYRATQIEWDEGIGSYAVVERASGMIVGYAGLQFHLLATAPLATPEIELFYGLGRAYRGKGYAFEACSTLRNHAFETLRVGRLVSVTERANDRSVRLLRRLGAQIRDHPTRPDLVIGIIDRPGGERGA